MININNLLKGDVSFRIKLVGTVCFSWNIISIDENKISFKFIEDGKSWDKYNGKIEYIDNENIYLMGHGRKIMVNLNELKNLYENNYYFDGKYIETSSDYYFD